MISASLPVASLWMERKRALTLIFRQRFQFSSRLSTSTNLLVWLPPQLLIRHTPWSSGRLNTLPLKNTLRLFSQNARHQCSISTGNAFRALTSFCFQLDELMIVALRWHLDKQNPQGFVSMLAVQ